MAEEEGYLVFKTMQLGLSIAVLCLTFASDPDFKLDMTYLTFGAYCGYMMLQSFFLLMSVLSENFLKRMEMFAMCLGSLIFMISGSLILHIYNTERKTFVNLIAMASGVLSILTAIVFIVDIILVIVDDKQLSSVPSEEL